MSLPPMDPAVGGRDFAVKGPQKARFARSARPGDEAELAFLNLQADIGEGPLGPMVLDPDIDEFDHGEKL